MARRNVFPPRSLGRTIAVRSRLAQRLAKVEESIRAHAPIHVLRHALLYGQITYADYVAIMRSGGYDDAEINRQYQIMQTQKGGDGLAEQPEEMLTATPTSVRRPPGRLPQPRPKIPHLPDNQTPLSPAHEQWLDQVYYGQNNSVIDSSMSQQPATDTAH